MRTKALLAMRRFVVWGARRREGLPGLYRGLAANNLRIAPQNSIRFVMYEAFKDLLGVHKERTDA